MLQAFLPVIGTILDKIIPDPAAAADAKLKALELAQRGETAALDADMRLALGQIEVNKIEAASPGLYKGGWRPAVGWVCVAGLAYTFLLQPLLPWLAAVALDRALPALPDLDINGLIALLGGMLGIGSMRTVEKLKGRA